jgi:hypothetical protein
MLSPHIKTIQLGKKSHLEFTRNSRQLFGSVYAAARQEHFRVVGQPEVGHKRRCGFLAFYLDNHTERGVGGRQYGKSEKDKQTLTGQNNTSSA